MSELEDQLNHILSDPTAMGQIAALAKSLGMGGGEDAAPHLEPDAPESGGTEAHPPEAEHENGGEVQAMLSRLTGGGEQGAALPELNPRLVQMGMRLLAEYNRKDDRSVALLAALRPFVRPARYAKLDRAMQIARLSRVIRVALNTLGERGGGRDV